MLIVNTKNSVRTIPQYLAIEKLRNGRFWWSLDFYNCKRAFYLSEKSILNDTVSSNVDILLLQSGSFGSRRARRSRSPSPAGANRSKSVESGTPRYTQYSLLIHTFNFYPDNYSVKRARLHIASCY